jgi:hypothetical protein
MLDTRQIHAFAQWEKNQQATELTNSRTKAKIAGLPKD